MRKSANQKLVGKEIRGIKIIRFFLEKRENEKKNRSYFECLCFCGKIFIGRCDHIKITAKSCGCKTSYLVSEARRLPDEQSIFRKVLSTYKKNATTRGISFVLSEKYFLELIKQNCYYCGSSPKPAIFHAQKNRKDRIIEYNGVDRIDSLKGYETNNVVSCCESCNKAKRDLSLSDFMIWIHQLIKFHLSTSECCSVISEEKQVCQIKESATSFP